jgi:hypothetical protein
MDNTETKLTEKEALHIGIVVPRLKTHYAPSGEWGNPKTYCGRYWTTDVRHRALMDEVTCKRCLELL